MNGTLKDQNDSVLDIDAVDEQFQHAPEPNKAATVVMGALP